MLDLENVSYRYDSRALAGVNKTSLRLEKGEVLSLLGPSGSGKSTLLKLISGELKAQQGKIESDLRPQEIQTLAQNEQLEANWTVLENILGKEKSEASTREINRARQIIEDFEITNEIDKGPEHLSGGQAQRALLAKKLFPNTRLLLLDEPFEHIDESLRPELIRLSINFCQANQTAVIWITHQNREAYAYSDKLAVMEHGKIVQLDRPQQVYFHPQTLFVAQFLGPNNIFAAQVVKKGQDFYLKLPIGDFPYHGPEKREALCVIRPEMIQVDNKKEEGKIKLKIQQKLFCGELWMLRARCKEMELQIKVSHHTIKQLKDSCYAYFDISSFHLLPEI